MRTPILARTLALLALGALVAGCSRTTIRPTEKDEQPEVYVPRQEDCAVHDFSTAAEVPTGAQNLGWVEVEEQESDDATFVLLRQKVCEKGGDGLSQIHWERAINAQKAQLQGNAWILP